MYPENPNEDFKYFIPVFKDKFENGVSCKFDEELKDNTVYIYCSVKCTCTCNKKRKNIIVEDNSSISHGYAIWEWLYNNNEANLPFMLVTPDKFIDRMCPNSDLIILQGYVVGEYCPKRNILLGSDWTHTKEMLPIVKKILSSL